MAAVLGLLADFAAGVAADVVSSIFGDALASVGSMAIYGLAEYFKWLDNIFAEALDSFVEAQPDPVVGTDPRGIVNVAKKMLWATVTTGVIVGKEVAEELFLELIQEGFSNAVQTSVGGALQTIFNIWRGSFPPNPDELEDVIEVIDAIDNDTAVLLVAMTGNNIPTSMYRILRGWRRFVDNKTRSIRTQIMTALAKWNDAMSLYYEVARSLAEQELVNSLQVIREVYHKGIAIIDMVAERALARLQELKVELLAVKEYLNMGVIDSETAKLVAAENLAEAEATYNTYTNIRDKILALLENVSINLDNVIANIDDIITRYVTHLSKFIEAGAVDLTPEYEKIQDIIKKLIAYRMATENRTNITYTITPWGSGTTSIITGGGYYTPVEEATYTLLVQVYYETEQY